MVSIDADVVRWSEPIASDRPLLVLLHGRGSNELDLFDLVSYLPASLVVASLRAPLAEGPGYSWYPLNLGPALSSSEVEVDAAVEAVMAWLDSLAVPASVGLLGFSQGGAMALQLLRRSPDRFRYVVQLSGFVIDAGADAEADEAVAALEVPVFWGRGRFDEVISKERIDSTAVWLRSHVALEAHSYEIAHSVSRAELADVAAFIEAQI
jgi:phospholipase/carboxylesterase